MKAKRCDLIVIVIFCMFMTMAICFFTIFADMFDQISTKANSSTTAAVDGSEVEESLYAPVSKGVDYYGSYNGHFLSSAGDSWTYFSDDGWQLGQQNEDNRFIICTNSGYEGAVLRVAGSNFTAGISNIMDLGVYSYSIDVSGASHYPPMTFNGITWGTSDDVVTAAYGEPDSTKTTSSYTLYSYDLSGATMTFYVYFGSGLQKVALMI